MACAVRSTVRPHTESSCPPLVEETAPVEEAEAVNVEEPVEPEPIPETMPLPQEEAEEEPYHATLTLDPELSRLAQLKSSDMNSNHYFAHESPTYGTAGQMLDTFGYEYLGVGENIAHHANVEKAEAAFMSSDGHRRNILGSQWDKVGIGIAYDENGNVYVTQLFAR